MRLAFSSEQEQFRESVRRFLDRSAPQSAARVSMDSPDGFDRALWTAMAQQLGLQGLIIPEEFGGSGFDQRELALVFEELGRSLAPSPLPATVGLAVNALLCAHDRDAQRRYLPGIADGSLVATLALPDDPATDDPADRDADELPGRGPDGLTVRAARAGDGWSLTGGQGHVPWAHVADLILLIAGTEDGPSLFAVDRGAPGLGITALAALDLGDRRSALALTGVPAVPVGAPGAGLALAERVGHLAAVATAAIATGGAARVLEMTVEYAGTRSAFGRPIGSFQAIKHTCADLLLEVEAARSAAYYAALAATRDSPDLPIAATLALLRCSTAFERAARDAILIHGGIGFTWEHPAHLYYRRACAMARYPRDAAALRADLSTRLGFLPA